MIPGEQRIEVRDAGLFGRVAVMLGGFSSERRVSLDSGNAVLAALQSLGVDAEAWDPAEHNIRGMADADIDRVWIALHGPGGEDGALQGMLQWLDMPYTGSGVMASAIAMDKIRSKHLFHSAGIATPDYRVVRTQEDAFGAAEAFGFPLVLKPNAEGSSVGIAKVFDSDGLREATELALTASGLALAERCIIGDEITVAVLQGEALPSIRIETPHVFYDYRAKYESDSTRYICPGSKNAADEDRYAQLALEAFHEVGCSGWGRVDFMTGKDGVPQVLEINTVPGMTSHSLVPMAAKKAGIDFAHLCWRILETSMQSASFNQHREAAANDA
ncbi:MAG: D-alanine--D-alanine ligase [Woeseia sp.]